MIKQLIPCLALTSCLWMGDFQLAMSWCGKNVVNLNNCPKNWSRKKSEFGRPRIEDKTGKVVGISEKDVLDFPDRISNTIYDTCTPAIIPEIYTVRVHDKNVRLIERDM